MCRPSDSCVPVLCPKVEPTSLHPLRNIGALFLRSPNHRYISLESQFSSVCRSRGIAVGGERERCVATWRAMDIVANMDMLLTLPLKYAHVINAGYGHDLLPLPIKMAPMEFFLHWHTSTTRDAAGRWLRDELARSFQSDPAGISSASFQAAQKMVAGQIGRGSAAKASITKNVAPARPDRQSQTAPSGTNTRLPTPASKPR